MNPVMGLFDRLFPNASSRPGTYEVAEDTEAVEERALALVGRYLKESRPKEGSYSWNVKPLDYPSGREALSSDATFQVACIHALMRHLDTFHSGPVEGLLETLEIRIGPFGRDRITWDESQRLQALLSALVRRHQPYIALDVRRILDRVRLGGDRWWNWMPVQGVLRSVQRYTAQHGISDELRLLLQDTRAAGLKHGSRADAQHALRLLDELLGATPEAPLLESTDHWGARATEALQRMEGADRERWIALLEYVRPATGSYPSRKWLDSARRHIDALGEDAFVQIAGAWLSLLEGAPLNEATASLSETSTALVRGIAWAGSLIEDPNLASALGRAAEECFRKIPDVGSRSVAAGNACAYALGQMPGRHGAIQLQHLLQRVKQPSAVKQIEKALETAAAREGLSRWQLEDLAVPEFGLMDGRRVFSFDPYRAELVVLGGRDVEIQWQDARGAALKSAPAAVKRDHAAALRDLKRTADDLKRTLSTQRGRLERLLLQPDRNWSYEEWRSRFLDHPLLSHLSRRLIWRFSAPGTSSGGAATELGIWHEGQLVDATDRPLAALESAPDLASVRVSLWHPIGSPPEVVLAWRRWLERQEVVQPFKQAHREVYLLTDAERRTETYSNRFAAHILRQHQLHARCRERGWEHRLEGGFDSGGGMPELALPEWNLLAQFIVEGIHDDRGGYSDAGICLYVSTDQVRFCRLPAPAARNAYEYQYEPVPLADVPPIVFSEVMRDVDLFVGVCSVGNDPNWQETGRGHHADYWQRYSFGELSETANTRRAALERLLPRLAIAPRCSLDGRFLVVRGQLRTYKIHLGSGNILMEPNDQYLCIVPGRGKHAGPAADSVFLPFEGDSVLSVILSKAFLLAADDKIADPTITRQIHSR